MSEATAIVRRSTGLLTAACVLGLVGVVICLVHLMWPTPLNFALFMLVGQGASAAAIVLYGAVILRDLRTRKLL